MPTYDYVCKKCKKKFSAMMRLSERETKKIKCPKCASLDVSQVIQPFFATTSKKS
jgi:putative FmdB family regulatory protein